MGWAGAAHILGMVVFGARVMAAIGIAIVLYADHVSHERSRRGHW